MLPLLLLAITAGAQLLQPLPAGFKHNNTVWINQTELNALSTPFNYTGSIYFSPFYSINVTGDTATTADLEEISQADFIAFDERFFEALGPNPALELMFNVTDFVHEAPVYLPATNQIFFSAYQTSINLLVDLNGTPPTLSNVTFTPTITSVNGGYLYQGNLYVAASSFGNQTAGAIFVVDPRDWTSRVLVNNYRGFHLNDPDDLVITRQGIVYFTDPNFGYIAFGAAPSQVGTFIYALNLTSGALKVVEDRDDEPNGIALSADQKKMYITTTGLLGTGPPGTPLDPLRTHDVYAYDIKGINIQNRRLLHVSDQWIPDGIKVATSGNIYTSAGNFVDVLDSEGVLLGKIRTALFTNNLVFAGPEMDQLWLVGEGAVYRVSLAEKGVKIGW